MSDEPLDLDKHRGMAAQKATEIRRAMMDVESRARARLTRLLIVPTGVSQMAAASSWEKPDAPTRMSASRWPGGSAASALRTSSNSSWLCCWGGDFRLST